MEEEEEEVEEVDEEEVDEEEVEEVEEMVVDWLPRFDIIQFVLFRLRLSVAFVIALSLSLFILHPSFFFASMFIHFSLTFVWFGCAEFFYAFRLITKSCRTWKLLSFGRLRSYSANNSPPPINLYSLVRRHSITWLITVLLTYYLLATIVLD